MGKRKIEDADNVNAKGIDEYFEAVQGIEDPGSSAAIAVCWCYSGVFRPVFQRFVLPLNAAQLSFEAVIANRMYFLTRKIYPGTCAALGGSLETNVAPEDFVVERDRIKA